MVSFQNSSSPTERKSFADSEDSSKKRKWFDDDPTEELKAMKEETLKLTCSIDLHLEQPLPSEWQRCLDLQSGEIHFYNKRTHKRTRRDPRESSDPVQPGPMSLDLELNLSCENLKTHTDNNDWRRNASPNSPSHNSSKLTKDFLSDTNPNATGVSSLPPWMSSEEDYEEMIATVCMRCHMLVMLHKSSPECPNCKFMHPVNQNPLGLLKPSCRLLCCKD